MNASNRASTDSHEPSHLALPAPTSRLAVANQQRSIDEIPSIFNQGDQDRHIDLMKQPFDSVFMFQHCQSTGIGVVENSRRVVGVTVYCIAVVSKRGIRLHGHSACPVTLMTGIFGGIHDVLILAIIQRPFLFLLFSFCLPTFTTLPPPRPTSLLPSGAGLAFLCSVSSSSLSLPSVISKNH